ncbi:MAG: phosphohistidine phosphatase SixA [Thaumarchaeota archaeon]|nr:phosphohistidine phosphatase SixA [Nitrososphaerota archaeon]
MELVILRHGEAGNRSPSASKDFERGLTASGRKEIEDVAKSINGLKLVFDKIATSPLTRARETAEIVAKVMKKQKDLEVWDELKPEGETADLYRRLSKLKGESCVLLVGHEPYLSGMISELISGGKRSRILLKKGGMAKVDVDSLASRPSGVLRWLLTPRQIKKMS